MKGKVDDFIGSTFDTHKGGVLTVVGVLPKVRVDTPTTKVVGFFRD